MRLQLKSRLAVFVMMASTAGVLQQTPAVAQQGTGLEPKCADIGENAPEYNTCWMELSNRPGCYIWNFSPQLRETVTWSGGCAGSKPSGEGVLRFNEKGKTAKGITGVEITLSPTANVFQGPFVDGKKHGQWVACSADGDVAEGTYVEGKQRGPWVDSNARVH